MAWQGLSRAGQDPTTRPEPEQPAKFSLQAGGSYRVNGWPDRFPVVRSGRVRFLKRKTVGIRNRPKWTTGIWYTRLGSMTWTRMDGWDCFSLCFSKTLVSKNSLSACTMACPLLQSEVLTSLFSMCPSPTPLCPLSLSLRPILSSL